MIEIAHLYLLNSCGHNCRLCCNKLYDIDKIPCINADILKQIHTLCLTGGDPFHIGDIILMNFIENIRKQYPNIKTLYAYTSGFYLWGSLSDFRKALSTPNYQLDGITISPKDERDWKSMREMIINYRGFFSQMSSNRLIVFNDQIHNYEEYVGNLKLCFPKMNMQILGRRWDTKFKNPKNEGFYRLPILLD